MITDYIHNYIMIIQNEIFFLNNQIKLSQKEKYKLEVCKKLLSCLKITLHNDLNYDIFYPLQILFPFILHYDNDEPFIYRKLIQKLNIIMLGDANISNKSAGASIKKK